MESLELFDLLKRVTRWLFGYNNSKELLGSHQCTQNVDENGPHHRCFQLIVSFSFNQAIAVERGRSHELVGFMVGAVYVHVLRTLVRTYIFYIVLCDYIILLWYIIKLINNLYSSFFHNSKWNKNLSCLNKNFDC